MIANGIGEKKVGNIWVPFFKIGMLGAQLFPFFAPFFARGGIHYSDKLESQHRLWLRQGQVDGHIWHR